MLSGAVRAAVGVPTWAALAISVVATVAGLIAVRRHLCLARGWQWIPLVLGAVAAAGLCVLMFNPELGALVTVGGGDAGNHVSIQHAFVEQAPGVYDKFVVFHAVAHWLGTGLGLTDADGFALAFYLVLICVFLCVGAAGAAFIPPDARRGEVFAACVVLTALLVAGVFRFWGPWLHYQQADGFYAHVFGLVPLLLGWLGYAVTRSTWGRVATITAWIGLARFTYGLNLGDALVAGALVLAWEAVSIGRGRARTILSTGAGALLVAASVAFLALAPLRNITHGAIVAADVRSLLLAQAALVAFLALALWSSGELRHAPSRLVHRLLLFPLAFGAVSLLVQVLHVAARWPQRYYFLKYNFHPVVLLSVATAALLPFWLTRRSWRAAIAVPALVALPLIASATHPQWFTFRERAFRESPYERVDALTDPVLVERVRGVLSGAEARSGGYLEPNWPRSNFINASLRSFNAFEEGVQRFDSGKVDQASGTCVFWLDGAQVEAGYAKLRGEQSGNAANVWQTLRSASDKQCVPHERRWRPGESYELCWRCGPPATEPASNQGSRHE